MLDKSNSFKPSTSDNYLKWRECELASALISGVGFAFALIDYEINYGSDRTYDQCKQDNRGFNILRFLNLISTLISIILMVMRNYNKSQWIKSLPYDTRIMESIDSSLMIRYASNSKKRRIKLKRVLEILLMCLFPYPYLNSYFYFPQVYQFEVYEVCYYWSEVLLVCMLFRFILISRTLANYSRYNDILGRYICGKYQVKSNSRFAVKCLLKKAPLSILFCIIAIPAFLLLGIGLRVFERPFSSISEENYGYIPNSIWCIFVTMSTIGYGDFSPNTTFGRTIVMFAAFIGGVLFSMTFISLQNYTSLSYNQHGAFITILKASSALKCIERAFQYGKAKRKRPNSYETLRIYDDLRKDLFEFKLQRKKAEDMCSTSSSELYQLKNAVSVMNKKINELNRDILTIIDKI